MLTNQPTCKTQHCFDKQNLSGFCSFVYATAITIYEDNQSIEKVFMRKTAT